MQTSHVVIVSEISVKRIIAVVVCALIAAAYFAYTHHNSESASLIRAQNQNHTPVGLNKLLASEDPSRKNEPADSEIVEFGSIANLGDYERFKEQARHDAAVAYLLALKLVDCRNLDKSYEAVAEATHSGEDALVIAGRMADANDSKYQECKNIPLADFADYRRLLEFAADNGVVDAQTDYATLVANEFVGPAAIQNPKDLEEYRRRSMNYLARAAASGSSKALMNMSLAFEDGILTQKNSMSAYAYMYAYRLRSQSSNANIDRLLNNMSLSLTTQQLLEAKTRGERIANDFN